MSVDAFTVDPFFYGLAWTRRSVCVRTPVFPLGYPRLLRSLRVPCGGVAAPSCGRGRRPDPLAAKTWV